MSGGSLNYSYGAVEEAARELRQRAQTPLHRAFATHLDKVAKALHDTEWVLSYDYSEGAEVAAIEACFDAKKAKVSQLRSELEAMQEEIKQTLEKL